MSAIDEKRASDSAEPPDGKYWDLLVIGGGTAGLVAAKTAASFGATVLLVERDRTGGDCLWTGCVPSKALLSAGHAAAGARFASRLGVHVGGVVVDFDQVMSHVREAIQAIQPHDSPQSLREVGVRVIHGTANFTGARSAVVDATKIAFRQAIIATGSAPTMVDIPGLADASPYTSDTIWSLSALPQRLLVIGGGNIGCELGQAFARLGSQVTLVQRSARLLPKEDPEAAQIIHDALVSDGVAVKLSSSVQRVESGRTALFRNSTTTEFDAVLVAAGRRPSSASLGLAAAGVAVDSRGHVAVSSRLQTTNRRIWAAGDVTDNPQFTHTAGVHASLAATNAILGSRRTVDNPNNPRVTYTHPEVASFGVSLNCAIAGGLTVHTISHDEVDRAIAEGATIGFTRLIFDGRNRVVGASVVGPRAGETLGEVVLGARNKLKAAKFAGTTHSYPTYNDGVWKATIAQVRSQLASPTTQRVTRLATAIRRVRVR